MSLSSPLVRFRLVLGLFMIGLILSGLTAFPLLAELELLTALAGVDAAPSDAQHAGWRFWILTVRHGLEDTYTHYPWMAYGTDWLAFGHLVIAMFFVGPFKDPLANRWVLVVGVIACCAVIPLALICGALRSIPFYWRLIDCSFGIVGALPLLYCLRLVPQIEDEARQSHPQTAGN